MRTSLNTPREVLDSFDEVWEAEGLESRSRAAREVIQEYTERHTRLEEIEGKVIAAVAFDYEHTLVIGFSTHSSMSSRISLGRRNTNR